jgi:hypothetical protein
MDTVVITRPFNSDLEAMAEYTRSLKSRQHWPGAVLEHEMGGVLGYQVGMRLKAAVMTDVNIEERLGAVDRDEDGSVHYNSVHRVLWPNGQVADATAEYVFQPGTPNTLQFSYSYPAPSSKIVKTKELPAFRESMEKVVALYVDKLTQAL